MTAVALPMKADHVVRKAIGITDAILVLLALGMAWATGYRLFGPGRDYVEYARFYIQLGANFDPFAGRFEPGFELVAWIMGQALDLPFEVFVMTLAFVALLIKLFLFRRYLAHPYLAALVYFLVFYPVHEYTQLRAAMGISLGFLAVHRLLERRWAGAAVFLILGILFHYSVMILALAALASLFMQGTRARVILLVGSGMLIVFSELIATSILPYFTTLNPLLGAYFYNELLEEDVNLFAVSNLMMLATASTVAIIGMSEANRYREQFVSLAILAFVALAFFGNSPVLAQRTKEMLLVAIIFLVFRPPTRTLGDLVPIGMLVVTGLWINYRYFDQGILGL